MITKSAIVIIRIQDKSKQSLQKAIKLVDCKSLSTSSCSYSYQARTMITSRYTVHAVIVNGRQLRMHLILSGGIPSTILYIQ